MEEINDLLGQLHTLLDDYDELLEMNKDTSKIEDEITSRVRDLKIRRVNKSNRLWIFLLYLMVNY